MDDDFTLTRTPRLRSSPFFEATKRAGMTGVTVYNHNGSKGYITHLTTNN